jgi:hypothetical protein
METEIASHILCERVALAEKKFHHLEMHFKKPSDYNEIPLCKILYFIKRYGTTGRIKKMGMH